MVYTDGEPAFNLRKLQSIVYVTGNKSRHYTD